MMHLTAAQNEPELYWLWPVSDRATSGKNVGLCPLSVYISQSLQRRVTQKHQHRCSYCLTPEAIIGDPLTIDHILPEALGGETREENLCLACWSCNLRKQKRITAVDPDTGLAVRLFHPNQQLWAEHFSWSEDRVMIVGLTATGRTTISALQMNHLSLLKARRIWRQSGWNPLENQ